MKLLHRNNATLVVVWSSTEKRLLETLAELYPLHQPEDQPLSRGGAALPDGAEAWLHAARADEINQHRAWLKSLLRAENFLSTESGWQQELSDAEVESLLQILNSLRVGAWRRLGSPEALPKLKQLLTTGVDSRAWLMMLAGELQMGLLLALHATDDDPPAPPTE
jgi:hypothetical protein